MNIFEALRQSHDVQRTLSDRLIDLNQDTDQRRQLFDQLKVELAAHEAAEERYFYMPVMEHDAGLDLSRHAIAEHHEMDEMVEDLEATDPSTPAWMSQAKALAKKINHHTGEEEHKFFQMAGKILSDEQKNQLAIDYLAEMDKMKISLAESA